MRLLPVVLSGGSGTRLWPASRQTFPTPFMKIGSATLLQQAIERAGNRSYKTFGLSQRAHAAMSAIDLGGPDGARPSDVARELGVAGKILLGSDFPNLPYPYALQLAGLVRLGLGEDWLRAVCWDNPVALFGLPELPASPDAAGLG